MRKTLSYPLFFRTSRQIKYQHLGIYAVVQCQQRFVGQHQRVTGSQAFAVDREYVEDAFKDTGSDLSFALALLNDNNDGVVLNGIYSREMSNIYAKPIKAGKSKYTISEQEQEAIDKAIESNGYNVIE